MAQLHSTLLYFVCPAVDTWDGSSGGLSLGALRLGGGNVEAGGVASQEEIAGCTCSGGSTCQGVNVDAKDGMRLAEVLRRRRRGVLGVETGGGASDSSKAIFKPPKSAGILIWTIAASMRGVD
eukprot:jgi/Tetstr1/427536/TSEL_017662.t1